MAGGGSMPATSRVEGVQRRDSSNEHQVVLHLHVLGTAVKALLELPGDLEACL